MRFRAAGVQIARTLGDKEGNIERGRQAVLDAAEAGATVIALPELSTTGYFATTVDTGFFEWAEPIPGPSVETFEELAKEAAISIILPLFEFDPEQRTYYNSAAVISPSGLVGLYRKRHIPDTLWMREKFYFTPGNLGYRAFQLPECRVGVSICYDRHFPETFRHLAYRGAEIVFSVNNTPTERSKRLWLPELQANASTNGTYVVQVNACGSEGSVDFFGLSAAASPDGTIVAELGSEPGILLVEIDPDEIQRARLHYGTIRDTRWEDLGILPTIPGWRGLER